MYLIYVPNLYKTDMLLSNLYKTDMLLSNMYKTDMLLSNLYKTDMLLLLHVILLLNKNIVTFFVVNLL